MVKWNVKSGVVTEIDIKLSVIGWEKPNWASKPLKRKQFINWWWDVKIFANIDKVWIVFLGVDLSQLLFWAWFCSQQYIGFFKQLSEHCHFLSKVCNLPKRIIIGWHLRLPFRRIVLRFGHTSRKRKIIPKTKLLISFKHQNLVIKCTIWSLKRSYHNYRRAQMNKFWGIRWCIHIYLNSLY